MLIIPDDSPVEGDSARFVEFGDGVVEDVAVLLRRHLGRSTSTAKGPFDIVTEADHAAESLFAERLARAFPAHEMIGEEVGRRGSGAGSEYCWVLDPLDGTVNFAAGHPFFAVSLALLHRGVPVIGWVCDPVHGERFRAVRGAGATLNGTPIGRPADGPEVLPVGLSTGFIDWALGGLGGGMLAEVIRRFGKVRILGSQALHLCYVAAGRLRLAASVEAKLWDDAAGALIVAESGRRYVGQDGEAVFPLAPDSPLWAGRPIRSIAADAVTAEAMLGILRGPGTPPSRAGEGS